MPAIMHRRLAIADYSVTFANAPAGKQINSYTYRFPGHVGCCRSPCRSGAACDAIGDSGRS